MAQLPYATRDEFNYIGKTGLRRKDGLVKASGTAQFTRDVYFPGMLIAKTFESPYAHAVIKSMDTSKAEVYPGVYAVLRYDDPELEKEVESSGSWTWACQYQHPLNHIAHWWGQPMGFAIAAVDEQTVDEAMKLVEIDWEVLPFELDYEKSASDEVILEAHRGKETNIRLDSTATPSVQGDVEQGFKDADHIVSYTFRDEEDVWAGVEALSCVAVWRGEHLDIWVHNQTPNPTQLRLAGYHGAVAVGYFIRVNPPGEHYHPANRIHVHSPYQGGQFGGPNWNNWYCDYPLIAAWLAKRTQRPVKHIFDRSHFDNRGYDEATHYVEIGFKNDGTITALRSKDYGSTIDFPFKVGKGTGVPNTLNYTISPYVNKGPKSCYRHGMKECGGLNLSYSIVAAELGMQMPDVALKNDGCKGHSMEWVNENVKAQYGWTRDSLQEVIAAGKAAIGWDDKWHAPGTKQLANGRYHGLGFAFAHQWEPDPNTYLQPNQACVILQRTEGSVRILGRHADGGWTGETSYCQIVADELGANYDQVEIVPFEDTTFELKQGMGSSGLVCSSVFLVEAARRCKAKLLEVCTEPTGPGGRAIFPGLQPEDLDAKDGFVFEINNPDNRKSFFQVCNTDWGYHDPVIGWAANHYHGKDVWNLMRQATFMEVEVDTETGEVIIKKVVNVNDVGKCITPESVNGQQYGGSWMGIGNSRQEQVYYDPRTGAQLNDNLIDYKWFSMNDIEGPMEQIIIESGMGFGAYGLSGCSEATGALTATSTSDAIYNAIGKRITTFPTTPDLVLKALGKI
ncbi:MAG: molybdopterin-dependent oxidoreductase [Dehalococcoidales bacterium]|nr:molybdopterin-dependent oxidoreductase [Dehalococcoidales bacterium]